MIPWTGFTVQTAPTVEPVSTAKAKDHLDVTTDVPDNIGHAIKLGIRDLYDNPSETITGRTVSHTKAIKWLSSVDKAYTFA